MALWRRGSVLKPWPRTRSSVSSAGRPRRDRRFSLRAWELIFGSLREVLGEEVFLRFTPTGGRARPTPSDAPAREGASLWRWRTSDRRIRLRCPERLSRADGRDRHHRRRSRLTTAWHRFAADRVATEHMQTMAWTSRSWRPAATADTNLRGRRTRQRGFTLLPITRYFRLLD